MTSDDRSPVDGDGSRVAARTPAHERERALLTANRDGDPRALDELVRMHRARTVGWAWRYAHTRDDAEDIAQEAFANVIGALSRGKGPTVSMGLYLATAVRHAAMRRGSVLSQHIPVEDVSLLLADAESDVPPGEGYADVAYATLPTRWRQILWLRDVEDLSLRDTSVVLGLTLSATKALHRRARHGLRVAYLDVLARSTTGKACPERASALSGYVREALSAHDRASLEQHLDVCTACSAVVDYLGTVKSRFALMLPFPLLAWATRHPAVAVVASVLGAAAVGGAAVAGAASGEAAASPQTVLTADTGAGVCEVVFIPNADDGNRSRFETRNTGGGVCQVSFTWDGQTLMPPTDVPDTNYFQAPRTGTYDVRLLTPEGETTASYTISDS